MVAARADARNGESIVSVPKQAETLIAPVTRPLKLSRGATNAEQTLWQGYATDADTRVSTPHRTALSQRPTTRWAGRAAY